MRRGRRSLAWHALVLATGLTALVTVGPPVQRAAAVTPFSITTDPALDPAFSPAIYHYVVRCTGHPTTMISTTGTGTVSIGGRSFAQPASVPVGLVANQAVYVRSGGQTYGVRCLPANFPRYTSAVSGTPQAHGFLVTLTHYSRTIAPPYYVTAFDSHGVPAWWHPVTTTAAGGDWLVDWGTSDYVAELTPAGTHVLTITYPGFSSYRAAEVPIPDGKLNRGMDAQVP